jgi:hypothetical protein
MGFLDDPLPNLARYVFLHPAAREVYVDWDAAADEQASLLRGASLPWRDDGGFTALLADLQAVPAFVERWSAHRVTEKRRGTKALVHPHLGPLLVDYEALLLGDDSGQRLYAWLPADVATAAAFDQGAATPVSPAQLRVVGEG